MHGRKTFDTRYFFLVIYALGAMAQEVEQLPIGRFQGIALPAAVAGFVARPEAEWIRARLSESGHLDIWVSPQDRLVFFPEGRHWLDETGRLRLQRITSPFLSFDLLDHPSLVLRKRLLLVAEPLSETLILKPGDRDRVALQVFQGKRVIVEGRLHPEGENSLVDQKGVPFFFLALSEREKQRWSRRGRQVRLSGVCDFDRHRDHPTLTYPELIGVPLKNTLKRP